MVSLISGLAAGATHALTGPDHVAAVAPLAFRPGKSPWISGIRWGFGHSAGVALVGLAFLALRKAIPLNPVSSVSERLVGITLVVVGAWAFRSAMRIQIHTHTHQHDAASNPHTHVHVHVEGRHIHSGETPAHQHGHAAFGVGTLHGLAGSSHFLGVLPALALPTVLDSGLYLTGFGIGTIIAMAGLSVLLGCFAGKLTQHSTVFYRRSLGTLGCITGLVGVYWLAFGG